MTRIYEFRDPIHGFIQLDEWERDIINHPAFQRLRRVRQLACTDMVYPGATHTRFEHSLGVMHVATRLFDAICQRDEHLLTSELGFTKDGLPRQRKIVRLAALLHDIGHAPFSHAAEEILPTNPRMVDQYTHEQYSAAIVEHAMTDVIDHHPTNRRNFGITVRDIRNFFLEAPARENLVWKDLVSSQLDADRMDYMLRDSYHAGVSYGHYDLNRVVATVTLVERPDQEGYAIGLDEDGVHAAEGLIIARYMMFTQVYFHKTRVIYDYHLVEALKEILAAHGGHLPPPDTAANVRAYLDWDDWKVLGALTDGLGGDHGKRLRERDHFRRIRETGEVPTLRDDEWLDELQQAISQAGIVAIRCDAEKSWYKLNSTEVLIRRTSGIGGSRSEPLSRLSSVVKEGLQTVRQRRLYVPKEERQKAELIAKEFGQKQERK